MVAAVPIPTSPDLGEWHDQHGDCLYVVARQDGTILSGMEREGAVYTALRTHRLDGEELPLYGWALSAVASADAPVMAEQVAALVIDTFSNAPTIVSAGGGFRA